MNFIQRPLRITIPLLLMVCLGICVSGCELWRLKPVDDSVQAEVDNAVTHDLEGVIVCVNRPGENTLYAAGWDNREEQTPADPDCLFKIASISKLYIAVATAKMVNAGRLSLDKTLAEYLPELSGRIEYADEITLRMLVQHRSGIPNFIDDADFTWDDIPKNSQEALELVLDDPGNFKPDRRYQYSNTNYLLIGTILDNALGYSHHQYIREEILVPLGLHHTFGLLADVNPDDVMSGYSVGWEPDVKMNDYTIPGGSMVATAEDVSMFLRALIDGSLLTDEEQAIYSSIYEYEHTGLLPGYESIARYHEDLDAVVVLFANTSGGNSWTKASIVYRRVLRVLRQEE